MARRALGGHPGAHRRAAGAGEAGASRAARAGPCFSRAACRTPARPRRSRRSLEQVEDGRIPAPARGHPFGHGGARAVGMSRNSAYKLRARLKGQPFDIAWEAAFRHGYDDLPYAALELALEGEEV